jgi:uncharacterized membrane protein
MAWTSDHPAALGLTQWYVVLICLSFLRSQSAKNDKREKSKYRPVEGSERQLRKSYACLNGISITTDDDDAAPHGVHPSKELNMNATVSDQGRTPDVPQLNEAGKPPSQKTRAPAQAGAAAWLIAALLVLSAIPLAFGAFRLTQLAGGADITPANARFFASPLPIVLHIVSASVYAILGAFQFAPAFRRRRPGWHRAAGRLLVACGLLVGLSALWMTLFYPRADGTGALLYVLRLLFGSAMVISIVLGFAAIRRGDVMRHRAWMMRGYAIGLGAGTQVLTLLVGELILGPPSALSGDLLLGAAWVINLAVAEWAIRKRPALPARTTSAVVSDLQ